MLQILGESIHNRHPIFSTLQKTSDLADEVIRAAYEISVQEVCRSSKQSRPDHHLHVIAMGRLGMREFDLGSDADLVFALPDDAVPEKPFWTSVVERLINVISSYTQEGIIFTIDTRLRPMGRDGELVQTESSFKRYFTEKAEAWEGIAYMKARAVAGDLQRGTGFLSELQEVDWRRYGTSSNLGPMLVAMRQKLDEEQGQTHPFKAGAGGYYDIDFMLMYLRLRDAGLFFRSLNTPERIEVLRTSHSLTRSQAETLARLAVFFRSLDHGIRVSAGPTNRIPTSRSQREMATELLGRWSGVRLLRRVLGGPRRASTHGDQTIVLADFCCNGQPYSRGLRALLHSWRGNDQDREVVQHYHRKENIHLSQQPFPVPVHAEDCHGDSDTLQQEKRANGMRSVVNHPSDNGIPLAHALQKESNRRQHIEKLQINKLSKKAHGATPFTTTGSYHVARPSLGIRLPD